MIDSMREVMQYLRESNYQDSHDRADRMRDTLERWLDIANHIDQLTAIKMLRQELEEVLK